ncbi:MAG: 16S rRNA (uracil(1498)-N(3))-methyltransferase, partial [Chlamydiae bacterium]|nr:16S rRNA (uracil(1498)-N(3))-methyltransferase [Chlamydiota bacterium]
MPIECFYINDTLSLGKQVFLREKELHHLSHVVRVQVGEEVSLVNGKGTKAKASLLQVSSREAKMEVLSVEEQSPSPHTLILAQGMPRIPRLEYIVEKSTELGVTEIWLFPGERGEKTTLSPSGQERLQHILVASMKQCGRLFLPQIRILPSLLQWKKEEILYQAFFGDVRSSASSLLQALSQNSFSSLLCVIGSE